MHLGMFDDLWSAASLVPSAREDGLDVFLIGNRNCPPFVRGTALTSTPACPWRQSLLALLDSKPMHLLLLSSRSAPIYMYV